MPFDLGLEGNDLIIPLANSKELLRKKVIISRYGAFKRKPPRPSDFHDFQQKSEPMKIIQALAGLLL